MKIKSLQTVINLFVLMKTGMLSSIWSIRVFSSDDIITKSLSQISMDTPTLQPSDVYDVQAEFVADPFIIEQNSRFFMFFEVLNKASGRGEIGLATSVDGRQWNYRNIVLREKFHLSYPQVFKDNDEMFMLPETAEIGRVLLYKAKRFPYEWEIAGELLTGSYLDPSIVKYNGKWWMFAGTEGKNLHLFYADQPAGPWLQHPASPLITMDLKNTRPAGRIIVAGNCLFRYTQDGSRYYGSSVTVFKVSKLSESEYEEKEAELILSGTNKDNDWRKDGMHHIDQLKINDKEWLVAVDGHRFKKSNYFAWRLDRFLAKIFS